MQPLIRYVTVHYKSVTSSLGHVKRIKGRARDVPLSIKPYSLHLNRRAAFLTIMIDTCQWLCNKGHKVYLPAPGLTGKVCPESCSGEVLYNEGN